MLLSISLTLAWLLGLGASALTLTTTIAELVLGSASTSWTTSAWLRVWLAFTVAVGLAVAWLNLWLVRHLCLARFVLYLFAFWLLTFSVLIAYCWLIFWWDGRAKGSLIYSQERPGTKKFKITLSWFSVTIELLLHTVLDSFSKRAWHDESVSFNQAI